MILVDLGGYSVSWAEAGTAFGNAVAQQLQDRDLPATYGRLPAGYFHCAVEDQPIYGRLISIPIEGGIHCVLASEAEPDPTKISLWRQAIEDAISTIEEYRTFHWSALISPSPRSTGSNYTLAAPATVGPIRINPGYKYMRELARNPLDDKFSRVDWGCWPATVNGSVRALDRDLASDIALEHLHRTCELIGVAWDAWWTVRLGPSVTENQPYELAVPESAFPDELGLFYDATTTPEAKERILPAWLSGAWSNLDGLPHLQVALASFYEAIQLSVMHPSFATIGFVATVETVGAGPASNTTGKVKNRPGAKAAFRAGLASIVSPAATSTLTTTFYGRRSSTAHSGKLHGTERRFGYWPNIYFGPNPAADFYYEASRMRKLSRIVLANALISGG